MSEVPHLGFIVASYAIAAAAIAGMIGVILWDYRRLNAELRALEGERRGRADGSP